MKKQDNTRLSLMAVLFFLCVFLGACGRATPQTDLWANALYTENTELGSGAKTLNIEVTAGEKTITFTLHSDCETVGDALTEQKLVTGEVGAYGLYIKTVNGILADYEKTHSFWAFNQNGVSMPNGVSGEIFADGAQYELVYTIVE